MSRERAAGGILAAAAAATVVMMANHPTDAHAGGVGAMVHGSMIVLLLAMGWGFAQFALIRGAGRGLVSAGLLAFAVSVFGHLAAATINGFVVPTLAAQPQAMSHDIFRFAWYTNQAFAKLAVVMAGAAYVLWSIDLMLRGGTGERVLGAGGFAAGAAMAVIVITAAVPMDVGGALLLYGLQALWAVMVGVQMMRGALQPKGNAATSS